MDRFGVDSNITNLIINTFIITGSDNQSGSVGLNFAIPINRAVNIYNDLKLFINSCYSKDYKYNDQIIQKINLLKRTDNSGLLIFFRIIMIYFKDLFVFAKSKDIKYLVFRNLDKHYEKITNHHINTNWELCINVIENTLNNIYRNSSIPLSISGMLIDIRDTINENNKESFSINNWLEIE